MKLRCLLFGHRWLYMFFGEILGSRLPDQHKRTCLRCGVREYYGHDDHGRAKTWVREKHSQF